MKTSNLRGKIIENRILFITIILFVIYWVIESLLDTFLFRTNTNLIKNLFFMEIHESWHRFLIFGFFIFIGLYSQKIITKRRKAEQENIQKLVELNQMRKDIIIRVSHELKTPLNAIYGASQRLYEYLEKDFNSYLFKYVDIIKKGGNRLKQLISDIIDASKIDYNKMEIKREDENIVNIIKESIEELIYYANKRRIFLNVSFPKILVIEVDKIRIQQVVTNILSNAIKNTPPEGTINIKLLNYDDFVDLSIEDTGIGLTKEEKEQLFKRFGKIERYGRALGVDIEGSGLGLYISNEIVKLHNGRIIVESEGRHQGSKFTIRLYKNISNFHN